MRLSLRTGLAAFTAAALAVLILAAIATAQFERTLRDGVDQQLEDRAATAPILVAIGERVAVSELNSTIAGARVQVGDTTMEIGRLPDDELPPIELPGWSTARADGQDWRLYARRVDDVPAVGDTAIVELAEPLGDVQARVQLVRRRMIGAGLLTAVLAGLVGLGLGRRAARPLTRLREDVVGIDHETQADWRVADSYSSPEVDEIAAALNATLGDVAAADAQRRHALTSARAFAASATHELRTPLQSAMTNLDIAASKASASHRDSARADLDRMRAALEAVRSYADADLVDPAWFDTVDLADLVEDAVAAASPTGEIVIEGDDEAELSLWADGVRLAVNNLLRNAQTHGAPADGSTAQIIVTIDGDRGAVVVDDNGPGIPTAERERVIEPFERGTHDIAGSGLGLAFVVRVATSHGGSFTITESPLGGCRTVLSLRDASSSSRR